MSEVEVRGRCGENGPDNYLLYSYIIDIYTPVPKPTRVWLFRASVDRPADNHTDWHGVSFAGTTGGCG